MIQVQTSKGLQTLPRKYSYWKHRNGNIYQVIAVTNLSDRQEQYPVTITYIGPNGKEWSKTAFDWFEKMTPLTDVMEAALLMLQGTFLDEFALGKLRDVWRGMMQQAGDDGGS